MKTIFAFLFYFLKQQTTDLSTNNYYGLNRQIELSNAVDNLHEFFSNIYNPTKQQERNFDI